MLCCDGLRHGSQRFTIAQPSPGSKSPGSSSSSSGDRGEKLLRLRPGDRDPGGRSKLSTLRLGELLLPGVGDMRPPNGACVGGVSGARREEMRLGGENVVLRTARSDTLRGNGTLW